MADIRRPVGLLEREPVKISPEPGIDDIGVLVTDFERGAGCHAAGPRVHQPRLGRGRPGVRRPMLR